MDRILNGLDSPQGLGAFIIVVSLLAGFMIAFEGALVGEREYVVHFVVFAVTLVAVVVGAAVGWNRVHRRDEA